MSVVEHLRRRAGRVESFALLDRNLGLSGDRHEQYDVALTRRVPGTREQAWLKNVEPPLLYDIGDVLIGGWPENRRQVREQESVV